MNERMKVKIGQIWQDWDSRLRKAYPRYLEIEGIDYRDGYVICKSSPSGRITKIKINRLKESSTGYRLVGKAERE
jgi:hypothetical protein